MPYRKPPYKVVYHAICARPRLVSTTFLGAAIFFATPIHWRLETRGIVAWDVAVFVYLALVCRIAQQSSAEKIRLRAAQQDDGALVTLVLSTLAALACFVAIALELSAVKSMVGQNRVYHALLVATTIPLAWSFIHSMFALHYAHEYYDAPDSRGRGLIFPNEGDRSYWDFLYFAFIIGTSGQTADVIISCDSIRKLALVHCVLAFFFNIAVLGLTVNVASSLL